MKYWGYQAIGVDYAEDTVKKLNQIAPDLDIRKGDVTCLEFEDEYFDGYWSLGVIEHFWEGYERVLSEMKRVLKEGGYAFVSFPCISRLDRAKILIGGYPEFTIDEPHKSFNQFAFDISSVRADFENIGFKCVSVRRSGGLLGIERIWPAVSKINRTLRAWSTKHRMLSFIHNGVSIALAPLCGHSAMLVLKKENSSTP